MAQIKYAKTRNGSIIARKTVDDTDTVIKAKLDKIRPDGSKYKRLTTVALDSENYTGEPQLTEDETTITEGWTDIAPKMSVNARKKVFDKSVKELGASLIGTANYWINDYYDAFDSASPKHVEWLNYRDAVKTAYQTIKTEALAISDYDELIAYIKCEPDPLVNGWRKHIPDQPEPE